jgi:hypothetical protein
MVKYGGGFMDSKTPNIFFAPIPKKNQTANFDRTILKGVEVGSLSKSLSQRFTGYNSVKLWGVRDAKKAAFLKTKEGDIVCFYQEGMIIGYAIVHDTFVNRDLAEHLWGVFRNELKEENYNWQNILWFSEYHPCQIEFNVFKKMGGYKEKFSIRGYLLFNEHGTHKAFQPDSLLPFLKNG